jgi:hypothetical protein
VPSEQSGAVEFKLGKYRIDLREQAVPVRGELSDLVFFKIEIPIMSRVVCGDLGLCRGHRMYE